MATQALIIDLENKIIAMSKTLDDIEKILQKEIDYCVDTKGCYKENSDVWGTLQVNLELMASKGQKLCQKIREARSDAEKEK